MSKRHLISVIRFLRKQLMSFTSPWVVMAIDLLITNLSFVFVSYLFMNRELIQIPGLVVAQFSFLNFIAFWTFYITQSYKGVVRFTNNNDLHKIFLAQLYAFFGLMAVRQFAVWFEIQHLIYFNADVIVFQALLSLNLLIASRFVFVFLYNKLMFSSRFGKNIMIYGAGQMGMTTKRILNQKMTDANYNVLGFIDDDTRKAGKKIGGSRIYKTEVITEAFIEAHNLQEVLIAINTLDRNKIRAISDQFLALGLKTKLVPVFNNWVNGSFDVAQIKEVNLEDLLERDKIELDKGYWGEKLKQKTVLVTGGAGSIGSEIVRQLVHFKDTRVVVLDQSESALYDLEQSLIRQGFQNFKAVISSVCDKKAMRLVFETYTPHYIFHAAAYKHVPLMEQYPKQAVCVNVLGTQCVADLAVEFKVQRFVMVSTDKAVNPTNVMGATKRAAELYIATLAKKHKGTKFMTTRFGNVLGSNGSVIPLFKRQLREGGPLTVTHKDIIRYFMTIPEACQLVIEAGLSGEGSEIFVFDMGDPVKIYDLAKNMIRMSGFKYPTEMGIKITGLRPGEKLYEELLGASEDDLPTHNPKIKIAKVYSGDAYDILNGINKFSNIINTASDFEVVANLKRIVPEFKSQNSKFQDLDDTAKSQSEILQVVTA